MKSIVIISTLLLSLSAFADHHKGHDMKDMSFEDMKAHMQTMITARTEALSAAKICVDAAKDKAALKKCRETMKESRKDMKKAMKKKKK